ncbi:unnamed protein product [Gadus morhua 'NCC']
MKKTIPQQDQRWIASTLWRNQRLRPDLQLWYEPPVPGLIYNQVPSPDRFFTHRLLVWMPYHLWKVSLSCPKCGKQLTGAGMHKRARQVLDVDRYYLMVTETLRCNALGCVTNYLSTSQTVLDQLSLPLRGEFRLILTRKYACDIRVIRMLRERTLGNSSTRLAKQLRENHGEEWLQRVARYLEVCADFVDQPSLFPVVCQEPPEPVAVPTNRWLLTVYGKDLMSRMDHIKASITSTFGAILKMDSTKKVTKKLAGAAKGTALWMSSVSNEVGQVLISVLTAQEGPGLDRMVSDLIRRYSQAGVAPPLLLYVDCGCCRETDGETKLKARSALLSYSGDLVQCVNTHGSKVFGRKYVPSFRPPAKYTGELIGVDYLYRQTGNSMQDMDPEFEGTEQLLEDLALGDEAEDEGFQEDVIDPTVTSLEVPVEQAAVDVNNIPGLDRVDRLAEYLVGLRN